MLPEGLETALIRCPVAIFDYDSTMVNTKRINFEAYREAFKQAGFDFEVTFDEYNQGGGTGMKGHIGHIARAHGVSISQDLFEAMKITFKNACINVSRELDIKPFPYVEEALKAAGGKVFVVTKNFAEVPEASLTRWGFEIDGFFSSAGHSDKSPVFAKLIEGYDAAACLCFDDHDTTLRHAKALGMTTVGVNMKKDKKFVHADYRIHCPI